MPEGRSVTCPLALSSWRAPAPVAATAVDARAPRFMWREADRRSQVHSTREPLAQEEGRSRTMLVGHERRNSSDLRTARLLRRRPDTRPGFRAGDWHSASPGSRSPASNHPPRFSMRRCLRPNGSAAASPCFLFAEKQVPPAELIRTVCLVATTGKSAGTAQSL